MFAPLCTPLCSGLSKAHPYTPLARAHQLSVVLSQIGSGVGAAVGASVVGTAVGAEVGEVGTEVGPEVGLGVGAIGVGRGVGGGQMHSPDEDALPHCFSALQQYPLVQNCPGDSQSHPGQLSVSAGFVVWQAEGGADVPAVEGVLAVHLELSESQVHPNAVYCSRHACWV